jgi:two-component system C4-dicarboxylate transport response regulator DctD
LGEAARQLDLRILGSVKQDPARLVADGLLRADLYHRFNAGALRLPPLRDRPGDAEWLLDHFAAEAALRHDLPRPVVPSDLRRQLDWHRWPGNVREVRTLAERLVIGLEVSLAENAAGAVPLTEDYDAAMAAFESRLLQAALMQTGGRKAEAADLLRIPRKRLYLRLRLHGLA